MNRWTEDAKIGVETAESVGGSAGYGDSTFGSNPSKRAKSDFGLRTGQTAKTQFRADRLPSSTFKQSMSLNNAGGSSLDMQQDINQHEKSIAGPSYTLFHGKQFLGLPQKEDHEAVFPEHVFDLHHIRDTILKQEAVFREQVRELHRVHKVQALLLAEMREKDSDGMSCSSGMNLGVDYKSPPKYAINSGNWNCLPNQRLKYSGPNFEHSKGDLSIVCSNSEMGIPPQEQMIVRVPFRRTFDLERPPEDNDDDYDGHSNHEDSFKPVQGIQFLEIPPSGKDELESDISLNLNSGWNSGRPGKDRGDKSQSSSLEVSRTSKRLREVEEAAPLPSLSSMPDSIADTMFRPATVATESFLGGLWGLQLGRIVEETPRKEKSSTLKESEVPVKKERHSLELELNEKVVSITPSNDAPHWLLQASAAKPPKSTGCRSESPSPILQESKGKSAEEMMKLLPSQWVGEHDTGSGPRFSSVGEQQVSGTLTWKQSHPFHSSRQVAKDDVEARLAIAHQAEVFGSTSSIGPGYGHFNLSQVVGDSPSDAVRVDPWEEWSDRSSSKFVNGAFAPSNPLLGGFGVELSLEGSTDLGAEGLVQVGPAVSIGAGAGTGTFVSDSGLGIWYHQKNSGSQIQYYQPPQQFGSRLLKPGLSPLQGPWQAPYKISRSVACGQGTVYVIPASTGQSFGLPVDGVRKVAEDISAANGASNACALFSPLSILVPPKAPFMKSPKLVLTHGSDGTTMELKLVSPQREGAFNKVERSMIGSSDEIGGESREKGVLQQNFVQRERDIAARSGGKWERDQKYYSPNDVDGFVVGSKNTSQTPCGIVSKTLQEGVDDADGGSSDAGSGGSGVGDVINPGDHASPSQGDFALGGFSKNLPAGEGEEGINMGEIGLQADSEAQSGNCGGNSAEKSFMHEELTQGLFSSATLSVAGRKLSQEIVNNLEHGYENVQKSMHITPCLAQAVEETPPVFRCVVEQSTSSFGAIKNLLDIDNQMRAMYPARQSLKVFKNIELELQQPTNSTSLLKIHSLVKQDSGSQGKEGSILVENSECSVSDHASKFSMDQEGRLGVVDIDDLRNAWAKQDMRPSKFSNFGDVCKEREIKPGHCKQLPEASSSDVLQNPFSPTLCQVSSLSTNEDMERQAEGRSKKVSQASETVQENGKSPLRTDEWIVPIAQKHFCSLGGDNSSCEEVDGTLVERLQGGEMEQKDSIIFCAVEGRQIFTPSEGRKMASIFVLG